MKELAHVKKLSAVKSGKAIKFLSPAVCPGCHCPMRMASLAAAEITGLSSLLVGMPECATHVRLFNPKSEGRCGELHWLYVMDRDEVVFGCRKGLVDALHEMDKAGAKAILLIATCVPELIGEDMEGIIHEVQPQISARITYVMLGQFKNFSYPPGYWKTLQAIGGLMSPHVTDRKRINILGRRPDEDHIPMPSLLSALEEKNLSLRYLAPGASLSDFQEAPDAALNLVVSPYVQPLAQRMEQEYGVPYISLHNLFDLDRIDQAYQEISQRFGFVWKDEFKEAREKAQMLQELAREKASGLRYVSAIRVDMPIALAGYLKGLGMEPLFLHLEEFYPEDKEHAVRLLELGANPYVGRMVNAEAEYSIIEKINPHIIFGYLSKKSEAIPVVENMYRLYGSVGYELTAELLTQILAVLDGTGESIKGGTLYGTASL